MTNETLRMQMLSGIITEGQYKAKLQENFFKNLIDKVRKKEDTLLKAGGVTLNRAKQTLLIEYRELELSSTEYKILEVLMRHPNVVFSRDQLMNLARGRDFMAFDRSIDVHISKLRAKLEPDPRSPMRIKTVWGAGYMFIDTP